MAYNIKDVFYLSTSTTVANSTGNGGSAQLDLSAYIDPIARGRTKGTGLAVYKVHWSIMSASKSEPIDDAESGVMSYGLQAGLGIGDLVTGGIQTSDAAYAFTNPLLVGSGQFYGCGCAGSCTSSESRVLDGSRGRLPLGVSPDCSSRAAQTAQKVAQKMPQGASYRKCELPRKRELPQA